MLARNGAMGDNHGPVPLPASTALRQLSLACAGVALASLTACPIGGLCPSGEPWQSSAISTTTTNDLFALTPLSDYDAETGTSWGYLLVGSSGTIFVVGTTFDESSAGSFVEAQQFSGVALRATQEIDAQWWIVGDQGLAAYSVNRGATWTSIVLNTTASLHGLSPFDDALFAAGENVMFARQQNGIWAELNAPPADPGESEGWGSLRDLQVHDGRLYAAGLAGVLWSTDAAAGEWVRESSGTQADLLALDDAEGVLRAVGTAGTMIERTAEGTWTSVETGTTLDLLDVSGELTLTAEGRVISLSDDDEARPFEELPPLEGAQALLDGAQLLRVGLGGNAERSEYFACADD